MIIMVKDFFPGVMVKIVLDIKNLKHNSFHSVMIF